MVSKARGGEQGGGGGGIRVGKAFVSVTQHTVPHAPEIDVYLLQHNQASTAPHTPTVYAFNPPMNSPKH